MNDVCRANCDKDVVIGRGREAKVRRIVCVMPDVTRTLRLAMGVRTEKENRVVPVVTRPLRLAKGERQRYRVRRPNPMNCDKNVCKKDRRERGSDLNSCGTVPSTNQKSEDVVTTTRYSKQTRTKSNTV